MVFYSASYVVGEQDEVNRQVGCFAGGLGVGYEGFHTFMVLP